MARRFTSRAARPEIDRPTSSAGSAKAKAQKFLDPNASLRGTMPL
jgi:hypothetical protein